MNSYELSRAWFDFCFENPEKVSPGHTAVFFFAIEHCNRLGWKEKFGLPSTMVMEAVGIKKHQTYSNYFNNLIEWGFFKLVQKSKNQYSANIISLPSALPKNGKALGKATAKHQAKHGTSTGQSTGIGDGNVLKPNNHEPNNYEPLKESVDFELQKDVADFFGFKEIENARRYMDIGNFLTLLHSTSQIAQFKKNWPHYKVLKRKDGCKHNLDTFIGSPHNNHEDGAWNKENWELKLKEYEQRKSGTTSNHGRTQTGGRNLL